VLIVYTAAIFLSATLLFLVQPMVGRLVLPALGGTPAVWNTCMVFFQTLLLIGYGYSHLLTRYLGARAQAVVHVIVLAAPLAVLPIALPLGLNVPTGEFPIPWLLGVLGVMAGAPFLALSTNGPLIQRWFSATDHRLAGNPYFLYSASNAGSLIALLGYPIVIEPWLTLKQQGVAWAIGYGLLVGLLAVCAVWRVVRGRALSTAVTDDTAAADGAPSDAVTWRTRVLWVLLSFAPSSLMIGATTFISTDVAPAPLLWVIPLSIYLVTMILAFGKGVRVATSAATFVLPLAVLALTVSMLMEARRPISMLVGLHLVTLAAAAMACHGRLSLMKPGPSRLTEFYFLMSLGGALGGLFNGIVAPLSFNRILEYPIALIMSVALALTLSARALKVERAPGVGWLRHLLNLGVPDGGQGAVTHPPAKVRRPAPAWLVPVGFGSLLFVTSIFITVVRQETHWRLLVIKLYVPAAAAIAMIVAGWRENGSVWRRWALNLSVPIGIGALYICLEFANGIVEIAGTTRGQLLSFGLPSLACLLLLRWPWRFTGGVAALLTLAAFSPGLAGFPLLTHRTFFGVHRVMITSQGSAFELMHGNTQHGAQLRIPGAEKRPITYYYPNSPLADTFRLLNEAGRVRDVGVVGLGVGTMAAYSEPGQVFTFYEIDPSIVTVARDSGYFTFLRDAEGRIEYKVGDGRRLLERAEGTRHDLIILDAFSSDSIPVHLLTVEAFEAYFKRLADHGVLLVHTSNRHLSLVRVLSGNAGRLKLAIKLKYDTATKAEAAEWKNNSEWIVLARTAEDLAIFEKAPGWYPVATVPGLSVVWTDDFSSILSVMDKKWEGE